MSQSLAQEIRPDFPLLGQPVQGKPLIYLDSAATSQKPRQVIDTLHDYYARENANIHRGTYYLSQAATDAFELARHKVRIFLNAAHDEEIVFVRGATEAINLVAAGFSATQIGPGDEIVLSVMEHHANIVPWQLQAVSRGAVLRIVPMQPDGDLSVAAFDELLSPRTKLVALAHVSNALGTIHPIASIIQKAHARDIPVLVDGCQAVPHLQVDVQALDADFYAFSGHKVFAPTGIGVLYGKKEWLEKLPPYQGGGDMIERVTFEKTTFRRAPGKFEAGTPHIAGAIGLGAALDYVASVGHERIAAYEAQLRDYAREKLSAISGITLIGHPAKQVSVLSFTVENAHPHDVGTLLDARGISIRAGHHCCQPLMRHLGISGTNRASLAFYNTAEEIDLLAENLPGIVQLFAN